MSRESVQVIIALVLVTLGVGLAIVGIAVPPVGEIHNSVLILFGEVAGFVGSLLGIDANYRIKVKRIDKENDK